MLEREIIENTPRPFVPSSFEEIASKLDSWVDIREPEIKINRYPYNFKTPFKIKILSGREEVEGGVLDIDLMPPGFPQGIEFPHVVVLDTPENNAVSLGRLALSRKNDLIFQLARFHIGYPAEKDMAYAARQAMQLPEISGILTSLENPEDEAFIVYLAREGPMIKLHGGIYNELGLNIPYTTAHARHEDEDNSKFKRRAEVCKINFEGMEPSYAKVLIIVDNTASGMQHLKVLEKAFEHIQTENQGGMNLDRVLVVSPLLTKYGALAISYFCAEYGIPTTFVASGFLLDCIGPMRYYSPVPDKTIYAANPKLLDVNRIILGDIVGKICSSCNWTARFSAAREAYKSSNEELIDYGYNNKILIERGHRFTPEFMKTYGISPSSLIPYSTLDEARKSGVLNKILKYP